MRLSHELSEALRPTTTYSWADDQVYTGLVEDSDWMGEALRQFRTVAPKHVAYLKKLTGMNWKLFKHPLSENGRLRLRFDMAKRGDLLEDPMIVVRLAYSAAADLYNAQIEVWRDPGTKIGGYETTDVDVEMLADAERFFYGARKFLGQLRRVREGLEETGEKRGLRGLMPSGLPMTRKEFVPWDSGIRHRDTGKVMVPSAAELASSLADELGANRWTKGFQTKAAHGAVSIYENDPSEVVALVSLVNGRVGFESPPQEPDAKVNEAVRKALESAMRRFRP